MSFDGSQQSSRNVYVHPERHGDHKREHGDDQIQPGQLDPGFGRERSRHVDGVQERDHEHGRDGGHGTHGDGQGDVSFHPIRVQVARRPAGHHPANHDPDGGPRAKVKREAHRVREERHEDVLGKETKAERSLLVLPDGPEIVLDDGRAHGQRDHNDEEQHEDGQRVDPALDAWKKNVERTQRENGRAGN